MSTIRFLLLEDNPLDVETIQAMLTDGGIDYERLRVDTRADFVAALETKAFDLILAAYALHGFDGISALEIARNLCPETPFIFVSASLGEELAIETLKQGATDYVLKQRLERLVPAVNRALQEAQERRERKRAEAARSRNEARLRAVAANLPHGAAFILDRDLRYLLAEGNALEGAGMTSFDLVGKTIWDALDSEIAKRYEPYFRQALGGESFSWEHCNHERHYISHGTPLRDERGEVDAVLAVSYDITERKRVELNAEFLATVSQELVGATTVDEIIQTVGKQLHCYLNTSICALIEINEQIDEAAINYDWHQDDLSSLVGVYALLEFVSGEFLLAAKAGHPVVVRNYATDPRVTDPSRYAALGIGAEINIPLIRDGKWKFSLTVFHQQPYDWRDDEIKLMQELASRVWAKLERARGEAALRESEEKYRTLFESIDQGFCLLEVLFDANDKAYDYRYLEINEAFEEQSGLTNAVGKTIRELVPNLEPQWGECYEQVVKLRESVRFEADVPSMNRVFDIYAVPSGAPSQNLVFVLFTDITERKRREANLAFLAEVQDDCARFTTAEDIMQTVGAKIGAYLNLSICAFVDVDEAQDRAIVSCCWHRADAPNLVGTYRISNFVSEEFYIAARAGAVVIVKDTNTDARTDAASCAALNVQSFIHVPLLCDGQWKFLFNVYDSRARNWREDEIELFSELANRIFQRLERARAEVALRQSEERYRTLFSSIDEGFCVVEVLVEPNNTPIDYRILEINPTFEQQTGIPQAVGKTARQLNLEDHWIETYGRVALTGEPVRFESGSEVLGRWFDVYACPTGEKEARKVAIVFKDISDRKLAEATIATDLENTRLLRDLSARLINEDEIQVLYDEIMATAIALTQADAGTVQILDNATQDLLLLASQGFNRTMTDHFYRVNASSNTPCGIALTRGTRTLIDFDVPECDDPDGSLRMHVNAGYLSAQSTPLISRSGKAIGMVSTHWRTHYRPSDRELRFLDLLARQAADLIDRRQSEAALRESEELKQSILDSSKDCIKVLTLNGEIVYVNTGGLHLLEINDPTLILNVCWLDLWQGEDRENAKTALAAAKAGNTGQFQGYRPTYQGTPKWWDILITPVRNSAGQVTQLLAVSRDITKQKLAETERERLLAQEQAAREQSETANRVKDEFLAVLSHELRSPLNPILGWARLLQTGKLNAERQSEALATIERNAKLQSQLIEDLLDISRIMQGKLSLTAAPVSLTFVISAAVETVRLAAEAKHIVIALNLDPAVSSISGDAARLQQVVWNLLTNAVKFTPNGGQVTVELRQIDGLAQIRVIDTGKGINPQFLPHVFEYFRQEDGSTTRKFGGLGLGLAIVRQIVEMHGGTVKAESQGENQGATFIVQLPLMHQAAPLVLEPILAPADTAAPLDNRQILLVDDDPDTREFQAFVLEQSGAKVTAVASGLEALQAMDKLMPDVIVSDIGMAQMDGYMLIQRIRSRPPERGGAIPAIALTAYAAEVDRIRAIEAGFQSFLTKPVEAETLVKALVTLLDGNQPEVEKISLSLE